MTDVRWLPDPGRGRARHGWAGRVHVQDHGRADVPGRGHGEGRAGYHAGDRDRHDARRGEQESSVTAIFTTL